MGYFGLFEANSSSTPAYSPLFVSKLIAACNAHVMVVQVWPDIRATPETHEHKPQRLLNKNSVCVWRQFQGHSSPVVAHMPPQMRKGRCLVA